MAEARIALLRAINVGGHRKVPMADLRALCEELGLARPRTYVASGNVAFDTALDDGAVAARLSHALEARFGFDVPVVVRSADAVRAVLAANPFAVSQAEEKLLHVAFLDRTPHPTAVSALDPHRSPGDRFAVRGAEIFVRYAVGSARSKLTMDWFERRLDCVGTARNLRTVRALVSLADGT